MVTVNPLESSCEKTFFVLGFAQIQPRFVGRLETSATPYWKAHCPYYQSLE